MILKKSTHRKISTCLLLLDSIHVTFWPLQCAPSYLEVQYLAVTLVYTAFLKCHISVYVCDAHRKDFYQLKIHIRFASSARLSSVMFCYSSQTARVWTSQLRACRYKV